MQRGLAARTAEAARTPAEHGQRGTRDRHPGSRRGRHPPPPAPGSRAARPAPRGAGGRRRLAGRNRARGAARRRPGHAEPHRACVPDERRSPVPSHALAADPACRLAPGRGRPPRGRAPRPGRPPRRRVFRTDHRPPAPLLPDHRGRPAHSRAPRRARLRRPGAPDPARSLLRNRSLPRRTDHGGRHPQPPAPRRRQAPDPARRDRHQRAPLRGGGPPARVGPKRDRDQPFPDGCPACETGPSIPAPQGARHRDSRPPRCRDFRPARCRGPRPERRRDTRPGRRSG